MLTEKRGEYMKYSTMLKTAINKADLTLSQISCQLDAHGLRATKSYLSKLQNGKLPPAGDKLNESLALILGLDPVELKAAAYKEKIPKDVLELLVSQIA